MSGNHGNLAKLKHSRLYILSTIQHIQDQIDVRKKYGAPHKQLEMDLLDAKKDLKTIDKEIEKREHTL